jgi:hypothetical protein
LTWGIIATEIFDPNHAKSFYKGQIIKIFKETSKSGFSYFTIIYILGKKQPFKFFEQEIIVCNTKKQAKILAALL